MPSFHYYLDAFLAGELVFQYHSAFTPRFSFLKRSHLVSILDQYFTMMTEGKHWSHEELLNQIFRQKVNISRVNIFLADDVSKMIQFNFLSLYRTMTLKQLIIGFCLSNFGIFDPNITVHFPLNPPYNSKSNIQKLEKMLKENHFSSSRKTVFKLKSMDLYYEYKLEEGLQVMYAYPVLHPHRAIELGLAIMKEILEIPEYSSFSVEMYPQIEVHANI